MRNSLLKTVGILCLCIFLMQRFPSHATDTKTNFENNSDKSALQASITDKSEKERARKERELERERERERKRIQNIRSQQDWKRTGTFSGTYRKNPVSCLDPEVVIFYRGKEYPVSEYRCKIVTREKNTNPYLDFTELLKVRLPLLKDEDGEYVLADIIKKVYVTRDKPSWDKTISFPVITKTYQESDEKDLQNKKKQTVFIMNANGNEYPLADGGIYKLDSEDPAKVTKVTLQVFDDKNVMGEYVIPNNYERYYLDGKFYGKRSLDKCKYSGLYKADFNYDERVIQIRRGRAILRTPYKHALLERGLYEQEKETKPVIPGQTTGIETGEVILPIYKDPVRGEYIIPNMEERIYRRRPNEGKSNWNNTAVFRCVDNTRLEVLKNKQREFEFTDESMKKYICDPPHSRNFPISDERTSIERNKPNPCMKELPIFDDNDGKGEYVMPNYEEKLYLSKLKRGVDYLRGDWDSPIILEHYYFMDIKSQDEIGTTLLEYKGKYYHLNSERYKLATPNDEGEVFEEDGRKFRITKVKLPIYNEPSRGDFIVPYAGQRVYLEK